MDHGRCELALAVTGNVENALQIMLNPELLRVLTTSLMQMGGADGGRPGGGGGGGGLASMMQRARRARGEGQGETDRGFRGLT